MLSKKIELPASDMAQVLERAKEQKLELAFDKISCSEGCIARILYQNSRRDHEALLNLMASIHSLEIQQIKKAMPPKVKLDLHLLTSKNNANENKRI